MKNLEAEISNLLNHGKSVLLVGPTEAGKTWFVNNKLIPLCETKFKKCDYVDGYPDKHDIEEPDVIIVDEFETFLDKNYLEKSHPDEDPYYEDDYIKNVLQWHQYLLAQITKPKLFILTRNERADIDFVLNNVDTTDWLEPVLVFEYIDQRN